MVFVSSAILGAATGTGLALMVAMMIVVYRYYVYRKKGAEWEELDRLEEKRNARKIQLQECSVPKDSPFSIQPPTSVPSHSINTESLRGPLEISPSPLHQTLQHQSKSFPPRLQRTPSISSQSSLDSAPSRHSVSSESHRGSSPQIRTYAPDGRSTTLPHPPEHPFLHTRSPSPMRAISLDARCCSPSSTDMSDLRTPSPSQNSLVSLISSGTGTSCVSPKLNRCLSPLLIPPRTPAGIDPGIGPASPLGALQLDLYTRQEGPMYITAPENITPLGRLHLRIKYDSQVSDLAVHLIEAHDLCSFDDGGFRDPYVRVSLIPEVDQRKRQTAQSIHRGETHPYFDTHFKFPVSRDQLQEKELTLQVLDYDRYSHNDIIGELKIKMNKLELAKSTEIWGDLIRVKKPREDRPELLLSLNYLPQAERLTVVIMKAKNLETVQSPYVKLHLIINGKRSKKKKTPVAPLHDPSNLVWNEQFTFDIPSNVVPNAGLEIYVIGKGGEEADAIGSCYIGLQEPGLGKQHWQEMQHNARKPTAMWHYLR